MKVMLGLMSLALYSMPEPLQAQQGRGVEDLRNVELRPEEREIRFWVQIGLGLPDRVMAIRQRGDSVSGRLLLIWDSSLEGDPYLAEVCVERWKRPTGVLCRGRLRIEPDWRKLLGLLDSLGLAEMPSSPVGAAPCPPSSPRGECAPPTDDFPYWLEVRTPGGYWRYVFQAQPDKSSPGLKRDTAIFELLSCAARMRGEGPRCETTEERYR